MDTKTVELKTEDALTLVQNILPVLEAIPAIAPEAGLASLAVSGAQLATPILFKIINDLEAQGVIETDVQTAQLERLQKVLDFTGSEWKPSNQ
jgi:hypothetical protein